LIHDGGAPDVHILLHLEDDCLVDIEQVMLVVVRGLADAIAGKDVKRLALMELKRGLSLA
jgi:hypothetical protein